MTARPAIWRPIVALIGLIATAAAVAAQDTAVLRRDVERRFDVLPLQNGLVLRPKSTSASVRSVELTDGLIAIDGTPATGSELREKLGSDDADVVIRLSYLDPDARRALFTFGGVAESQPRPEPPPARPARTRRSEDRVRFGGTVTIQSDEIVNGDVVVIGGSAHIFGEVTGDVVVVGGTAELGPQAIVGKDLTVVGGALRRDPTARIEGKVNEVGVGAVDLSNVRFRHMPWARMFLSRSPFGSAFALLSTIARFAVLSLLACIVLLVGREHVERVGARAAAEPLKAGLVGMLAELLFFPLLIVTILVLVVTIVGIPLLALVPFALLALAIVFLVGFAAVSYDLGRFVTARLGWPPGNAYQTTLLGIIVVLSPVLLGRIVGLAGGLLFPIAIALLTVGFLVEYAVWTVGLGAVALMRFDRRPITGAST